MLTTIGATNLAALGISEIAVAFACRFTVEIPKMFEKNPGAGESFVTTTVSSVA